jgi:hypothetical protein
MPFDETRRKVSEAQGSIECCTDAIEIRSKLVLRASLEKEREKNKKADAEMGRMVNKP